MESTDGGLNVILKYARLPAWVAPNKEIIFISEIEIKYLSRFLRSLEKLLKYKISSSTGF